MTMWISVLVTASGFIGLAVTILSIFFEIKPAQKKHISTVEMCLAIGCLTLLILGSVNLYYVWDSGDDEQEKQNSSIQEGDDLGADEVQTVEGLDEDLSPEELLVRQNLDLIQQLKTEYSEDDMEVVESESNSVQFYIQERAGYVFRDLRKAGEFEILGGDNIFAAKVIILDYSSDEIICTLTSDEDGLVRHSPGNQNTFYGVIFHDDYDIYVTPPLQVVSGEYSGGFSVYLEGKESEYTPLCQLRLCIEPNVGMQPSVTSSEYSAEFHFEKILADRAIAISSYGAGVEEAGILSWRGNTYFSINTKYVMDVSLSYGDGFDYFSAHQKVDGLVRNSNLIDLYFEFETEE